MITNFTACVINDCTSPNQTITSSKTSQTLNKPFSL